MPAVKPTYAVLAPTVAGMFSAVEVVKVAFVTLSVSVSLKVVPS